MYTKHKIIEFFFHSIISRQFILEINFIFGNFIRSPIVLLWINLKEQFRSKYILQDIIYLFDIYLYYT